MRKQMVNLLSRLFPGLIVKLAYHQLTSPQVHKLREHELSVLAKAKKEKIAFYDFDIQTYKWVGGDRKVLLIHGWEGQAGNFADLVTKLLQNGYTVYAFDGPSHGFSSKGKTSLFEFSELVGVMIKKFGVDKLVSHSFGGVATTFSLAKNPELRIAKYVLLTTPDKFSERIADVSERIGITDTVKDRLIERIESETQLKVGEMNVSDLVKNINVERAIIFHDKLDRVIPIRQSRNVWKNWAQCSFEEVEGTGHFRILRTDEVLNNVIEFLN